MRSLRFLSFLVAGTALAHPTQPSELEDVGWPDITDFLSKVAEIFPFGMAFEEVCGAVTAGQLGLTSLFGIPSTEDDGCADITMLYARGTCDPGNVGALIGPWFFKVLEDKLQQAGQLFGVNGFEYPASVDGYVNGAKGFGEKFADVVSDTIAACPDSKILLGGYSQGGMVIHNAAKVLGPEAMSKVSAVVIFGDPFSNQSVENIDPSKVKIICHEGDNICENGPIITFEHLNYAVDATSAAEFILSNI